MYITDYIILRSILRIHVTVSFSENSAYEENKTESNGADVINYHQA